MHHKKQTLLIIGLFTALTSSFAAGQQAHQLSIGAYAGWYERNTATDKTEVITLPISFKWRSGLNWVKLASSWVSVDGPGNVDSAISSDSVRAESGAGDIYLSAGRLFSSMIGKQRLWYQLSGKYKFATADFDKGLGTGEDDYSLTGSVFYPLTSATKNTLKPHQLYAKMTYLCKGDPDTIDLKNRPSLAVGMTFRWHQHWVLGGQWKIEGEAVDNTGDKQSLFLYGTRQLEVTKNATFKKRKLTPFILIDGVNPEEEIGLGITYGVSW